MNSNMREGSLSIDYVREGNKISYPQKWDKWDTRETVIKLLKPEPITDAAAVQPTS